MCWVFVPVQLIVWWQIPTHVYEITCVGDCTKKSKMLYSGQEAYMASLNENRNSQQPKTMEELVQEQIENIPKRKYTKEEIEAKRKTATLMNDRVTEAVFSNNKNNALIAGILNELRGIHNLAPVANVVASHVQSSTIRDALLGRKMIADIAGEASTDTHPGRINFTAEVQDEAQDGFAIRGTLSSSNIMRNGLDISMPYEYAPDVIGVNILGFRLPELRYSENFFSRVVLTNYDDPEKFFLDGKYSDYYLELPKLKSKESFSEKYHALWDICQAFKLNSEKSEEAIKMGVITNPTAVRLVDEMRTAVGNPVIIQDILSDEEFRKQFESRDAHIKMEGKAEGTIESAMKLIAKGLPMVDVVNLLDLNREQEATLEKHVNMS